MLLFSKFGVLAQLGEHLPYKQRVIGSSPIGPISFIYIIIYMCRSGGTGRRPGLKIPWVEIPVPVRSRSTAERKTLDFQGFFSCPEFPVHVQNLSKSSPYPFKTDFDSRFDSRIDSRSLKIRLWKAGKSPL